MIDSALGKEQAAMNMMTTMLTHGVSCVKIPKSKEWLKNVITQR